MRTRQSAIDGSCLTVDAGSSIAQQRTGHFGNLARLSGAAGDQRDGFMNVVDKIHCDDACGFLGCERARRLAAAISTTRNGYTSAF